jgi:cyclomaltodextrinase / maltogenic alpha-amylase / neopullulanase
LLGGKIIDQIILYDPKQLQYKTPFGAVKAGEPIKLKLFIKSHLLAEGVDLILRKDGSKEQTKYHFSCISIKEDYTEYALNFSVNEIGLYFYRFEIVKSDYLYFCGRSENDDAALIADWMPEWQLTIYDNEFTTPDWFSQGVIYQIFVDRFSKGKSPDFSGLKKDYILREDWGGIPIYEQAANGDIKNNDFFGGNLAGITSKLDYLADLGVTCIYLCPIFEAYSNHKYDTADYMNIDPMFGNTDDFRELCNSALQKGIRIVLDGVFSHTGSDSIYFNKNGHYGEGGAFNSKESPYYNWYSFKHWPHDYESWWGIKTLPRVNKEDSLYLDFITGESGVLRYWLKNGASGWRLDVADELPDIFLDKLRCAVKSEKSQGVIIGEVWEDASNKESYGVRRRYLLGSQLDSVMNYPFKSAIMDFVKGGAAQSFEKQVMTILQNYPGPSISCLMNIIGTHDTIRSLTALSPIDSHSLSRQEKANYKMNELDYNNARRLLMLASLLQFTLPGVPCIYYGDEASMQGYEDPLNRGCYPWGQEDMEILNWYKKLGKIRKDYSIALNGDIKIIYAQGNVIVFSREETLITAVNTGETPTPVNLPAGVYLNLLTNTKVSNSITLNGKDCAILVGLS